MTSETPRRRPAEAGGVDPWLAGARRGGITLLFLGMRAVMDIGGACAEGGPFVPVRPCPDGVPALMIGGIWIGLIASFVYAWASIGAGIPSFVGLLWPALFMSLGWNFLQYAFDPPFGEAVVYGWLVPGVLFELMGAIPLWFWLKNLGAAPVIGTRIRSALFPPGTKAMATALRAMRDARAATTPSSSNPDMVSELERLDKLHRSGALSDTEYEKAKRRLLA